MDQVGLGEKHVSYQSFVADPTFNSPGQDLYSRIRLLLLSRNSNLPPRTPRPSLILSQTNRGLLDQVSDYSNHASSPRIAQRFQTLEDLKILYSAMVVDHFGSLTGSSESSGMGYRRRQLSHPLPLSGRSIDEKDFRDIEVNQKSMDGTLGREQFELFAVDPEASPTSRTLGRKRSELFTIDPRTMKIIRSSEAINPNTPRYSLRAPTSIPPQVREKNGTHLYSRPGLLKFERDPTTSVDPTTVNRTTEPHPPLDANSHLFTGALEALGKIEGHHSTAVSPLRIRRSKSCSSFQDALPPLTAVSNPTKGKDIYSGLESSTQNSVLTRSDQTNPPPATISGHHDVKVKASASTAVSSVSDMPTVEQVDKLFQPASRSPDTHLGHRYSLQSSISSLKHRSASASVPFPLFSDEALNQPPLMETSEAVSASVIASIPATDVVPRSPSIYSIRTSPSLSEGTRNSMGEYSAFRQRDSPGTTSHLSCEAVETDFGPLAEPIPRSPDKLSRSSSTIQTSPDHAVLLGAKPVTATEKDSSDGLLPFQMRPTSLTVPSTSTVPFDMAGSTKRAKRAKTSLYKRPQRSPQSIDLEARSTSTQQNWWKLFLKRQASISSLKVGPGNLTARPPRKSKTFFDDYLSHRVPEQVTDEEVSAEARAPQFPTGAQKQGVDADEIRSMSPYALEKVISELESVLKEALAIAHDAADKAKPRDDKQTDFSTDLGLDNASRLGTEAPSRPEESRPKAARMKHRVNTQTAQNQKEAHELRKTIQEYHRTLTGLHENQNILQIPRSDSTSSIDCAPSFRNVDNTLVSDGPQAGPMLTGKKSTDPYEASSILRRRSSYNVKIPSPLQIVSDGGAKNGAPSGMQGPQTSSNGRAFSRQLEVRRQASQNVVQTSSVEQQQTPQELATPSRNIDWAAANLGAEMGKDADGHYLELPLLPVLQEPKPSKTTVDGENPFLNLEGMSSPRNLRKYMKAHDDPPVLPRGSSVRHRLQETAPANLRSPRMDSIKNPGLVDCSHGVGYATDFTGDSLSLDGSEKIDDKFAVDGNLGFHKFSEDQNFAATDIPLKEMDVAEIPLQDMPRSSVQSGSSKKEYSHSNRNHQSIRDHAVFSLGRSHKRAPIARDWSPPRKRFVAAVTCTSTALVGFIIGIYAGEAPAIQYAVVDENSHFVFLGNVMLYLGLAISNFLFWPLPLLHGRKPYTLSALVVMLPLLFPQALVVGSQRSPYDSKYRVGLLLPRALAGLALGFANINFIGTLLDLFGSSLQSGNPHQEIVNPNDARRHGGGMGIWLSIWTWCYIGSIGFGFFVGAWIIGYLNVSVGFWVSIILTILVILLNVVAPETRRSAYRRSFAEVRRGSDVSRRIARGEVMMHLYATGPRYWWQECLAGYVLCARMLRQPGFLIMALYQAWIYGQVVMVMILLGALTSKYYHLYPHSVALCVAAFPLGALLAIPFQKASLFSRARHHPPRTDSMTFQKRVLWTDHFGRRTAFMVTLPLAGLAYTLTSQGDHTPLVLPVLFSTLIGFLSNLALSECSGLIMENFDTSDLQPGMTGRPRRNMPADALKQRTNYSCFPRVTAGFATTQSFAFVMAAAATACGGNVEQRLGAQASTAVVTGVLLILTLLLMASLIRFRTVQIVPSKRVPTAILSGPGEDLPVIIGNPSGTTRRVSLLELGALTRWTEIRKRNKLLGDVASRG